MANSMTGFGRYIKVDDGIKLTVEIKSVNHRYLDLNIKLPRLLSFTEVDMRKRLSSRISRGKVDVFVSYERTGGDVDISYHPDVATRYYESLKQMQADFGLEGTINVGLLARMPDVFTEGDNELDEDYLRAALLEATDRALDAFVANRQDEGDRLVADLMEKLDRMEQLEQRLEERSPAIIEDYKKRILEKTRDLIEDQKIDESRVLGEVVIYADKVCIDEEMVRLKSHIAETRATLTGQQDVGRKMDFLAQELNRESNTILSKSTDVEIADIGIELKTLIEKIREQIQNLE
ncbi:MAG: YicC family protein [Lachnospiraceae bacterium]|nr:YicC family protein [Lachnospiraceae bacterium]